MWRRPCTDMCLFPQRKQRVTRSASALTAYIDEYLPRLKHGKREADRARYIQRYPIAHRIMATLRSKDIADFRREREAEGVSGNTIRLDFALLSRLFNFARSDWGMESLQNPLELAVKPKPAKGRERRLEHDEEEKIFSAASPTFAAVIRFALETAMRREEIAGLLWKNVNFASRSVFLPETKNNDGRTVPLSAAALDVLRQLPQENADGHVFNMTADEITHGMKGLRKATGIEDLCFHDFRHEAVSRFFENTDLDVMEIKAITGHKTLQMLARYTHLRTAHLADRLNGMRRGESSVRLPAHEQNTFGGRHG